MNIETVSSSIEKDFEAFFDAINILTKKTTDKLINKALVALLSGNATLAFNILEVEVPETMEKIWDVVIGFFRDKVSTELIKTALLAKLKGDDEEAIKILKQIQGLTQQNDRSQD